MNKKTKKSKKDKQFESLSLELNLDKCDRVVMKKYEVKIFIIMQEFDFDRVHLTMNLLNWTWQGSIPSIDELKNTAEVLLIRAYKEKNFISTGGFEAHYDKKRKDFTLKFVVASEWS